jgi:hypothetical protein
MKFYESIKRLSAAVAPDDIEVKVAYTHGSRSSVIAMARDSSLVDLRLLCAFPLRPPFASAFAGGSPLILRVLCEILRIHSHK